MGSADLPGKKDEKLKSENMQKRALFYVYVIFWEQSGQAGVENGAMLTTCWANDKILDAELSLNG